MEAKYWYGIDRTINPLGFGCWQLAGEYFVNNAPQGWGKIDEKAAEKLVKTAIENGIEFFDTAAGYGNGKSEEILGKAIDSSSKKYATTVCTKIELTDFEIKTLQFEENFLEKVEKSLTRLKRERIEILLLHNPPDNLDWQNFDQNLLNSLQKQGKIGTFGVSCKSITGAKNVVEANFGTCIEWVFNLLERRPIAQLFPLLGNAKMNFIARSPLSRGLFSAKYLQQKPVFAANDFRSTLPEDWLEWTINSMKNLNLSFEQIENFSNIALNYCLNFKEVSAVIPGIKHFNQLLEYLKLKENDFLKEDFVKNLHKSTDECFPKWQ